MLIGIDASRAVRAQPTGTELYSARLIEYLAKIDSENTYYLYSPTEPPQGFLTLPGNFHWRIIPFARAWTHIRLPLALWADKLEVLIIPAHTLPLWCPTRKIIVTLHDTAYELFPEAYSRFERWYQRFAARQAIRRATVIITPSRATKQDLVKLFQAPAEKIVPIHLGVDKERFTETVALPPAVKKLRPYFLMLGRLELRKNTARVIGAYGRLRQENPDLTTKLVLIGKPGYGYGAVEQTKANLPAATVADIKEPGYVRDVIAYMQGASAFIYPSLYEGFGLPALEAMAAGTPVITSDSSSLPEVVDDAAILVNPESIDELVEAMKLLATDQLTQREISRKGKERVKQFSWGKMARETLEVVQSIGKNEL